MRAVRHRKGATLPVAYAALAASLSLCYFVVPGLAGSGALFNVIGLSAAVAIVAGVRRNRPEHALAWYLFAAAQVFFVIGDVLYYTLPGWLDYTVDFPSAGDVFYVCVYPLIVAGMLVLIRARSPRRDIAALVDALIVGVGVGVVSWAYLMVPYAEDGNLPLGSKALSIGYPLMDVLVLAVTVRLAVDGGRRAAAFFLLVAGLGALVAADSVYGFIELNGTYRTGSLLDAGWIAYYCSWGTAALHPSMRTLSERAPDTVQRLGRRRLAVLAGVSLLGPLVELTKLDGDRMLVQGPLVLSSVGLFLLVVGRLRLLVRDHEEAERRERTLREAGASLVSAPTRAATHAAAVLATRSLAGDAADVIVCEARCPEPTGLGVMAGDDEAAIGTPLEAVLEEMPEAVRDRLAAARPVTLDPAPRGLLDLLSISGAACLLAVPLAPRDTVTGMLVVATRTPLSRRSRDGVEALASQVALALDAANLGHDLHRRRSEARFRSLVQNSSDIVTVVDAEGTIRYQSPAIEHVLGLEPAALLGTSLLELLHPDDSGPVAALLADLAQGRGAAVPQSVEARWRERAGAWRHTEMLCTDLTGDPHVGGIVLNTRDITERKAFEDQLAHQAFHDPITDLANRALFRDRVQHALELNRRDGTPLAVLFLDLDDFKTVNDSLGHAAGDQLLLGVGIRLRSTVRSADTVARLGGDEFALLLEHVTTSDAMVLADAVLAALEPPFTVDDRDVVVRASIGVAAAGGGLEGAPSADDLLRDADVAMYIAKGAGKGRCELFVPDMQRRAVRRLELTADLTRALENQEFRLLYQPIVELGTGRVTGVEALVRWQHPIAGLTTPAEFIPLAEETGFVVDIGRWVIREACHEAARLRSRSEYDSGLTVSVNLSPRQLQDPLLVGYVTTTLADAGLPPEALTLEITETIVMQDPLLSARRLRELKEVGVRVAVDDFGIGYSSLNYLRQFPFDILKVDKSFVDRIDASTQDRSIVEAIVRLALILGLQPIAEGIETRSQLERLRDLGCDCGQGYYMATPMEAGALAAFLASSRAAATAA